MDSLSYLLLFALGVAVLFWRRHATRFSISYIPGPTGASWLVGNMKEFAYQLNVGDMDFAYARQFGRTWRMRHPLGTDMLMTADPKAIHHVLQKAEHIYVKRLESTETARMTMGKGLVWASGETHARQRKIMNPAFTVGQIRSFVPIFRTGAAKLTQKWRDEISAKAASAEGVALTVNRWFSRVTIDILGETAFDYNFGALDNTENEVTAAFHTMFSDSTLHPPAWDLIFKRLWSYIPQPILEFMDYIPTREYNRFRRTLRVVNGVSKQLVEEKKAALLTESRSSRDIFSVLVQANVSQDPKGRLTDEELVAQMATLVLAGHITTATTLTFLFHELSCHQEYQHKMREEIVQARARLRERGAEDFSMEELEGMPLVSAAVKETLRYHPPVYHIFRNAIADDVLPLETPIKSASGEYTSEIPIGAGQHVVLSVCTYQRLPEIWGEDADQWNPLRFVEGNIEKESKMGLYANLMAFAEGNRGCIGWRFTILETMAIVVDLVENFKFDVGDEKDEIIRRPTGFMSAWVRGREREGPQLVLKVTPVA
ncbi:hypothetical protein PHLGIDRAFT_163819 [Phlebiopsis gigantea 11061_1 CR5-6]|uniref:Cytochrome P450 n=1 Tax=Phlebiopsis gigantea (strain 11061_1 CR5-6) TaxID=745531 RepID=A0A0C3S4V5_PHLG1|nr:hypothetical protein PHLGIDRAFT_163819 [Phlebiopsis gigantea 11061_1 CR5-6]